MKSREAIQILRNELKCIERNDGVNCDRRCENCDLVMEAADLREAYDLAISALIDALQKQGNQEEIVHCKDCKHWGKRELCEMWDHYISNEDFYCGCAERRTEHDKN